MTAPPNEAIVHATAVALGDRAALIRGAAGSGKSALALWLMAAGADLVADDRTLVRLSGDRVIASPPPTIAGLIEARGVGILRAHHKAAARLVCVVDLDIVETDRLPPPRFTEILGQSLPVIHGAQNRDLAPALLQYLKEGRDA